MGSTILGLGTPFATAYARDFSYLAWKNSSAITPSLRTEPQNSQTIAFLESAVNVDPKKAQGGGGINVVGDSALLPEEGPSGTIADIQSNDNQGKDATVYVVRSNDTISGVAKMFEVSPSTILWANGLSAGASLHEGQTLMILPVDGIQHTIKKGETINGLARKYGGKATDILEFNDLAPGQVLSVGDEIIIPNGKEGIESAPSSTGSSLSRVRARLIASFPTISGYYINPVPTGHKTQGIHGYNGVDIGAPKGTPVYAAAEGIVTASHYRAGDPWFGGYGNYIDVDHPNGTQTRYGHLSKVFVQVGAHVDQGQEIGAVGNTGHSTGSHLHFEVHGASNPL